MAVKSTEEMNRINWEQTWRMDKAYMRRLLEQNPPPRVLRAIGIDKVSVRKGHTYAISVASLEPGKERPVWMGDQGRTEEDMKLFFEAMGPNGASPSR